MDKRITIKDVAADVGVSISVVSYVLNDSKKVSISEQTRRNVLDAARRLGYIQNKNAAILRSGKSYTLGVVSYWDDSFVYSSFIKGIKEAAANEGYKVMIYSASANDDIRDYIGYYRDHMVDGLIIIAPYEARNSYDLVAHVDMLNQMNVKFTIIGEYSENINAPLIPIDYFRSTYVATKHFISKGCRHITYVSPPADILETKERFDGYRQAMEEHGLEMRFCSVKDIDAQMRDFRAVVTNKSKTAYFVQSKALQMGYKIPEDFEVIAGNTEYYSKFLYPSLTSVLMPAEQMGTLAAKTVLACINGQPASLDAQSLQYEYSIEFGNSTQQ